MVTDVVCCADHLDIRTDDSVQRMGLSSDEGLSKPGTFLSIVGSRSICIVSFGLAKMYRTRRLGRSARIHLCGLDLRPV